MGYILVSRRRGSKEVNLLSSRLYRQRSEAYDGFRRLADDIEDADAFFSEYEVYIAEVGTAGRIFTFAYRLPAAEAEVVEAAEAARVEAPQAVEVPPTEGVVVPSEAVATAAEHVEEPETVEMAEALSELEVVAEEAVGEAAPAPSTEAEVAEAEEEALEEAAERMPPQEAQEEEKEGVPPVIQPLAEEAAAEGVEIEVAPEVMAEEQPPSGEIEVAPEQLTEEMGLAKSGAAELAQAWEQAAHGEAVQAEAPVEGATPAWGSAETAESVWGRPVEGVSAAEDAGPGEAQPAGWGWSDQPVEDVATASVVAEEAPAAAEEVPAALAGAEAEAAAPLKEAEPAAPEPERAPAEAARVEAPPVGSEAAEQPQAPERGWPEGEQALESPPTTEFAAPPDLADTLGIDKEKEQTAGSYVPHSPLDLSVYTCEDCVFYDACFKRGQEEPASCGSFQWRAGL